MPVQGEAYMKRYCYKPLLGGKQNVGFPARLGRCGRSLAALRTVTLFIRRTVIFGRNCLMQK
jgi:hypothetical protein